MEQDAQIEESASRLPGRLLKRAFFEAPPERVAPLLLGKLLVHRTQGGLLAGRIVETEAYLGPHNDPPDPAAHSHRGPTPRNGVLFGPAGHAYVYSIYGWYFCMNITCEVEGRAGCVLLRALEPVAGLKQMTRNRGFPPHGRSSDPIPASKHRSPGAPIVRGDPGLELGAAARALTCGPSRLCQALGLARKPHNGMDLLDAASPLQVRDDGYSVDEILVTRRIGIRHAVDLPLRFALARNACVSGPKALGGKCIFLSQPFPT